ncbi:MAG: hypothetical protein GHHEDOFH_03544 [Pseudorhodoplanes sp.]|nr:hypothetical protein [Pseudorhodoplanes sp.]
MTTQLGILKLLTIVAVALGTCALITFSLLTGQVGSPF